MAFAYLAAASSACAVCAITRRNPVHGVLWTLALFLHVAGIYLLAGAEFLAVAQIIIYAGAILVFYLTFLMLLDLTAEEAGRNYGAHWILGVAAALGFVTLTIFALQSQYSGAVPHPESIPWQPSIAALGSKLYREYAFHVEAASLILLTAIVGAVVLAARKTSH